MFRKIREQISVQLSLKPRRVVLAAILLLNLAFIVISAFVISLLSVSGTEEMGFWQSAYYTVMMVLDAGNVAEVVGDVGTAGLALIIICLAVVIVGMVLFTGAVIGYLTNYISSFVENANLGSHKLYLSGHIVILNWNSRASEIINDLLYSDEKKRIVVLVQDGKEAVEREIFERISDTLAQEREGGLKNKLTVIVREGDTFSTKQLMDISIDRASSIIILGNDASSTTCKYELKSKLEGHEKGNPQVIKALVQVAELTGAQSSADDQKIIVEVEDDWTHSLVKRIIENKQVDGKCNIVPVSVNKILGRLLSQFSIMPELNLVYRELFSNKGSTFYSLATDEKDENAYRSRLLSDNLCAVPLTVMEKDGAYTEYFCAQSERDRFREMSSPVSDINVSLNKNYWLEQRNVIILGHNSNIRDIMEGFNSFRKEWNHDGNEIMNVVVIDTKPNLEKMDYYRDYPYVVKTVEADVYDRDKICKTIDRFVDANDQDTSVLILSDDSVTATDIDSGAIANLIYVRDVISRKKRAIPSFDEGKIDIVVEIINPKHYDIVKSYSVNNIVISNRYISKMVTQLSEKDSLFDFYQDILTYDDEGERESKEIYIKKVLRYFDEMPPDCTAAELIRAVYCASSGDELAEEERTETVVLGYVKKNGKMVIFGGDRTKTVVKLENTDKLIMYSNH